MAPGNVSRRRVMQAAGSGLALNALGVGGAGATARDGDVMNDDTVRTTGRHNVGTSSKAALEAAKERAAPVYKVLEWGPLGHTVSGTFSKKDREALRRRDDVRYVEPDIILEAFNHGSGSETHPWGIDRIDADVAAHNDADGDGSNETGQGAHVAIIDTGIDDDHEDLQGNLADPSVSSNHTAIVDCRGPTCNYPWSDDNDHGTHCAGIAGAVDNDVGVVGVGTEITLHAVKVLDNTGSGSASDVADGIKWVADQGYDVGSLSLGSSSPSTTIRDAVSYAFYGYSAALGAGSGQPGVLLVAAAGNSGPCTDCVGYPAAYNQVVAVSATSSDDSLASFSSTGPEVEFAAPGENIYSTVIGGYDTFDGTSMACPHVSGAAGLLMANGYTNEEAREQFQKTAEPLGGLGDNEQGRGLIDPANALCLDSSDGGSNTIRFTCVTGRQEVFEDSSGNLKARLHGRWSCADSASDVGFTWWQARPTVGDQTTVSLGSTSQNDFSYELDIADFSPDDDCRAYKFYAWAETDSTRDTGHTVGFWNDRSC